QKNESDEQRHARERRQRGELHRRRGIRFQVADDFIKHEAPNRKRTVNACQTRRSRRNTGAGFRAGVRAARYRRQVTPIRKPRPTASATVASGRSRTTSSSVSPIETAASCAASATALPRSETSEMTPSTLARACL